MKPADLLKRALPLAFAGLMGLAAVALTRQYLGQQQREIEQERQRLKAAYQEPVDVIVAAKDLEAGVTLEASHLQMAKVYEAQPFASRNPQDLLGKTTLAPLAQGEQVLLNKLRRPDQPSPVEGSQLSGLTPKGKRAVTISVDTITGVGGFVRPGDAVDILWTFKLPGPAQQGQPTEGQVVTLTLFQEVPILAVERDVVGQAKKSPGPEGEYTVTLALNPQETAFLLFAREQGRIQLSLRSAQDRNSQLAIAPANINTLLELQLGSQNSGNQPPRPGRQVEVYKGLKRDVVVLPDQEAP